MSKQITGELASEYCKRFQTSATREIQGIDNDPECFGTYTQGVVRYYRGALGDARRRSKRDYSSCDYPEGRCSDGLDTRIG